MTRTMIFTILGGTLIVFLTSCATTSQKFPVTLSSQSGNSFPAKASMTGKVIVFPLEDLRKDMKLIGRRTHLFGQVDTFETAVPSGERISQLLVDILEQKGWDAKMASPGVRPEEITADRVVTGKIRTLWAEATSHFGYTEIDAAVDLDIEILDHPTGVKSQFDLKDENAPKVVFFRNDLIQDNLNEIVSAGLNHIQVIKQ